MPPPLPLEPPFPEEPLPLDPGSQSSSSSLHPLDPPFPDDPLEPPFPEDPEEPP
eukprot:CAMPEP_0196801078 /NCGR_PEP_ID=MMETSP1362-20130617/719_1 /TAXON_ID=163516 /ORGANISM="Leptocylindrus danicus, Strain CCMP1856" /LENGTH=53 /DNA_ID=CAMNT_0042171795 /DNA_START=145 /DNA_END=303 /DNA_ORIENTATION=-